MRIVALILAVFMCFSCATATPVHENATPEEIEQINARNLEAIAKNHSTITGIMIVSFLLSIITGIVSIAAVGQASAAAK